MGRTMSSSNTRHPQHEVIIIGTGFAGLGMAINLKKAGKHDFVIFEREADVGGTWFVNNYPGCACDVQSHLYSFSFEPNPQWSRMFSPQQEILEYLRGCADKYAVRPHIRFNSAVTSARYDDDSGIWTVTTADGQSATARVVVSAMGPLDRPSIPNIKGLDSFKGKAFHSQNWDHDYDLQGKKVAVIGTGASSIQFVPQIAKQVADLKLFQRTAPWVMPKPDRSLASWEQKLFKRLPAAQHAVRGAIYGMLESRVLAFVFSPRLMKLFQKVAVRYINKCIKDPVLRAKVTPDYTIGCKRILISNDYYPALARDNVDVITDGIAEIRANAVVTADGEEHAVDAIIYGTGFHATDPLPRGVVFGRGGQDLLDAWTDGVEAYKGCAVSGFPNLFIVPGPNTGLGHNSMVYMIESQVRYVMQALLAMEKRELKSIDVRPEVQREFNAKLQQRVQGTIWNTGGCESWYLNEDGKNVTLWPGFTFAYRYQTRRFDVNRYMLEPLQAPTSAPTEVPQAA